MSALLLKLLASQKGCCYWCRAQCVMPAEHPVEKVYAKRERRDARRMATVDHVWPKGHARRNKDRVAACSKCNRDRGNPAEHLVFT